ncbi:uncharacterized protein DMENIID0001_026860 [Sergentomyia squamirostris]
MSGRRITFFNRGMNSQAVQAISIDLQEAEAGSDNRMDGEGQHQGPTRRFVNSLRIPNTFMTTNWRELTNMIHSSFLAQSRIENLGRWPTASPTRTTGTTTHNQDSFVINLEVGGGEGNASGSQRIGGYQEQSNNVNQTRTFSVPNPPQHQEQHQAYNFELPELRPSTAPNIGPSAPQNHHRHHNHQPRDPENMVQEALAQMPETRTFLVTLSRYMPYLCILLAKSCYDHIDGIIDCFALFITFCHANYVVRQEVANKQNKKILTLIRELIYISLAIAIVGFMLEKKHNYSLMFSTSFGEPFTLRNLLFSVGITDLILKLITVGIKIFIVLLPPSLLQYKGRGRVYLMTEAVSQLYRAIAPIQPWLIFLLESYTGYEKIVGVIFSAGYMAAKGGDLLARAKFVKRSFVKLLQSVNFGSTPSKEQQQSAGGLCPICHDFYTTPVMLECSHIFCEACVGTWFDKEQTCPLCRAKVVDDPLWKDGATTFFVQFY